MGCVEFRDVSNKFQVASCSECFVSIPNASCPHFKDFTRKEKVVQTGCLACVNNSEFLFSIHCNTCNHTIQSNMDLEIYSMFPYWKLECNLCKRYCVLISTPHVSRMSEKWNTCEAIFYFSSTATVPRQYCNNCHASGKCEQNVYVKERCSSCNGSGQGDLVYFGDEGQTTFQQPCSNCNNGTATKIESTHMIDCPRCRA